MAGKPSGKSSSFRTGGAPDTKMPTSRPGGGAWEQKGAPIPAMQPVSTTPAAAPAGSGSGGSGSGSPSGSQSGAPGRIVGIWTEHWQQRSVIKQWPICRSKPTGTGSASASIAVQPSA